MKTTKMSLANIQGKLSRTEMKSILAGSGSCGTKCSGYTWNPSTARYDYGTTACDYFPPVGGLPGGCNCPYSTYATACS
jgi:hypothetical protein